MVQTVKMWLKAFSPFNESLPTRIAPKITKDSPYRKKTKFFCVKGEMNQNPNNLVISNKRKCLVQKR